jgi:peptidoglycan-N-acetylmuramic acid deacetylase
MTPLNFVADLVCPGIRKITSSNDKNLYLTFDDGPLESSETILETLEELKAPATFFVVAANAKANPGYVSKLVGLGHGIGNHSLDHGYRAFFLGRKYMRHWIVSAENTLQDLGGCPTVGFRPPAGVRTPELKWALEDLNLPLVLWKIRFFDTVLSWSEKRALLSLKNTHPGDIILLHDPRPRENLFVFVRTLKKYVEKAREQGFEFKPLTRGLCERRKK